MPRLTISAEQRFWRRVRKGDICWTWMGGRLTTGYGVFYVDNRPAMAHRVAFELLIGPIPDGLHIDHLCRNPSCVNPDHLEPVTVRENTLRGHGITAMKARQTMCARGHPFDEANTIIRPNGARQCRACTNLRKRKYRAMG